MHRSSNTRRLALCGLVATVGAVGVAQANAASRTSPVRSVQPSVATAEAVASRTPTVSGDGRLMVYAGAPANALDTRESTIFLRDRESGAVTELTPLENGIRPGTSLWPVISADGCTVTIVTEMAFDMFRDDDGGDRWDVYRTVLPACDGSGDWELVSSRGSGFDASAGDDVSPLYPPAVSGEGTIVAYTHRSSATDDDLLGITLVDLSVPLGDAGRSREIAGTPGGAPDTTFRYHGLREPAISTDGNVLAFTSDADSALAVPTWGSGPKPAGFAVSNVFVWDRSNLDPNTNVRRVTLGASDVDSGSPAVSGDGSTIAFVSAATDLVPGAQLPACAPDCVPQVYLYDRATATIRLGSREPGDPAATPVGVDAAASQPALSQLGDQLVYVTRATNLFPTRSGAVGGPSDGDIVLGVPATGSVRRVSSLADGVTPAPAANAHPHLSAAGRVVVFDTLAGAAFGEPAFAGRQVAAVTQQPLVHLSDLDLGTVAVGYPGPEWYLVVANDGPGAFVPAAVEIDKPDFLVSGGSCVDRLNTPVPPGSACTVNLMFMPSVAGPQEATLTVREAGFSAGTIEAHLVGMGGDPALAPSPAGADGGSLLVGGRSQPLAFSISNVAFNPVRIAGVTLQGTNPDDFVVNTDGCTGTSVPAGESCTIEVLFAPTGAGRRTASMQVRTTDGAYTTMLLSGDAHYSPRVAVSSTTIVAGSHVIIVGSGFAPLTQVTISWADGLGRSITGSTDWTGGLQIDVGTVASDRPGTRTIVVQAPDGSSATADVLLLAPQRRVGPAAPSWPGR